MKTNLFFHLNSSKKKFFLSWKFSWKRENTLKWNVIFQLMFFPFGVAWKIHFICLQFVLNLISRSNNFTFKTYLFGVRLLKIWLIGERSIKIFENSMLNVHYEILLMPSSETFLHNCEKRLKSFEYQEIFCSFYCAIVKFGRSKLMF